MSKGMQQRLGVAQALVGVAAGARCSTSRPRRSTRSGGASSALLLEELRGRGRLRPAQLASALRDRARLRPGRDPARRRGSSPPARRPSCRGRAASSSRPTRAYASSRAPTREDAPRLVAEAVAAGRRVYGVRVLTSTLEDVYLEAVGGETDVSVRRCDRRATACARRVRRKVFAVVVAADGGLPRPLLAREPLRLRRALERSRRRADVHVDTRTFAGAFLLGLAMFATLFLGVVLAVFLTLGVVSGDAERGLLQPLVVRPVGRVDAAAVALRSAPRASASSTCSPSTGSPCDHRA